MDLCEKYCCVTKKKVKQKISDVTTLFAWQNKWSVRQRKDMFECVGRGFMFGCCQMI